MGKRQWSTPKQKSYAARFRKVFETAEAELLNPREKEQKRGLAHFGPGRPVITELNGQKRYVYEDGTVDERSIVSPEVEERAFEIGGVATKFEVILESDTHAKDALNSQRTTISEPIGRLAVAA